MVRLCAAYCVIKQQPGAKPADIARALGVAHSTVDRILPAYAPPLPVLWENNRGGLYVLANKAFHANYYRRNNQPSCASKAGL